MNINIITKSTRKVAARQFVEYRGAYTLMCNEASRGQSLHVVGPMIIDRHSSLIGTTITQLGTNPARAVLYINVSVKMGGGTKFVGFPRIVWFECVSDILCECGGNTEWQKSIDEIS